jgi:hypothetical protein
VLCAKVQYGGTKLASPFVRRMSAELGMLVIGSGSLALVGVII